MGNKQKKPSSAAVKTVKTTQRKCMFEYIAVNVISLFVFLSFGYIAVMAFFQTSVIDPTNYVGERILYNSDNIVLNLVFTCITIAALFALKKFFDKRIEDEKQMRNLALACLVTVIALTVLFMLITIFVKFLEKTPAESLGDAISKALSAPNDSVFFPMNFLLMALFVGVMIAMVLTYSYKSKHVVTVFEIALALYVVIIGIVWVVNVRSVPAADSYNIYEAATDAAQDKYTSMHNFSNFYNSKMYDGYSYFQYYPFQLGFVAFSEFVYRIFGTDSSMPIQIINVLALSSAYFAVARITRLLFKSRRIEFIAIIMLALCIQPILFCTFVYGNIIGMTCALWASLLLIKYFKTGQYRWIYPSGVLLVLAVMVKYNNMIYLIAFVIMLVIHIVKKKKWQSAAIAAALIIAVLGTNSLVIKSYEARADEEFSPGVSQPLYLALGLKESSMAPGWYTHTAKDLYAQYYLIPKYNGVKDASLSDANDAAWDEIGKRLDEFSEDSDYAFEFFGKKILSQWNEPTFESIWVSKVKGHTATEEEKLRSGTDTIGSDQMTGLTNAVYKKGTGQALEMHFNFYMQIMYILFAAGIYLMFIKKKTNIETVLLPLVMLGAFGYHLLFEGKSQYVLTYIPLMVPTAAYALHTILNGKYEKIKKVMAKIKHIPDNNIDIKPKPVKSKK